MASKSQRRTLVDGDLELDLLEQVAGLLVAAVDPAMPFWRRPEHLGDGDEVNLLLSGFETSHQSGWMIAMMYSWFLSPWFAVR
jgi:hypothetical protein